MADDSPERSRHRKRRVSDKLLVGEKVEVRSFEDGLKGSWHPATVIGIGVCTRIVEYTDILDDDCSSKLVESIDVSIAVEGVTSTVPNNYRGNIRPFPPHSVLHQESMINYGFCVDARVNDAWWEGVVFDHKQCSSERLVFFPDQGDQLAIPVSQLRLTLDWNEVSGDWEPRQGWLFLSVIRTFEEVEPLPISVRQIWYDVRSNDAFEKKIVEWMFGSWSEWNKLVSEVIGEVSSLVGAVSSSRITDAPLTLVDTDIPPTEAFLGSDNAHLKVDGDGFAGPYGSQELGGDKLCDHSSTECGESSSHKKFVDGKDSHAVREGGALESLTIGVCGSGDLDPEYCPQAIMDYMDHIKRKIGKHRSDEVRLMRLKAKKHLLYVGWKIWLKPKTEGRLELRYTSPKGKTYGSLYTACEGWKRMEEDRERATILSAQGTMPGIRLQALLTEQNSDDFTKKTLLKPCRPYATVACDWSQETAQLTREGANKITVFSSNLLETGELGFGKLHARGVRIFKKRKVNASFSALSIASLHDKMLRYSSNCNSRCRKLKKKKASQALIKSKRNILQHVLRSRKRAMQLMTSSPTQHVSRTVLSWLIDNDVVLPRQKVRYMRKRDGHIMMEGRVTRDGIKCNCCGKVYTLTNFEAHAGSTNHRPAANIFLEDGRSLLQCQMQMLESMRPKDFSHERIKSDYSLYQSDNVCSVCHDGGSLVLCDYCPSAFHLDCVGLEDLPEGKWFCPSCQCGVCRLGEFNSDTKLFTDKTVLYCDQCEREYHVGCLRSSGLADLKSCPEGNWFCSKKCSKIFFRLRKLLGKSNPLGVEGLSWTILQSTKPNDYDPRTFDVETMTEHHSKLCVALDILHECFVTIIEPRTKRDLVADILFNKESELNRLNFWGFYTIVLERGDELISVATIRIYGEKAAEMPLVGTRFQYRRKGMCRLLMDELEKLLSSLGVERLLLPAVPQLLETWTTSFGFTRMTSSDNLELLDYTFVTFQDSIMCQKLLGTSITRGNHKLTERTSRGNKDAYSDNRIISKEVVTVGPIIALPSIGIETTCSLAGERNRIAENSILTEDGYSPPSVSCSEPVAVAVPVGLIQEINQITPGKIIDEISVNVSPGKCSDDCVSEEMGPSGVMMEVEPLAELGHEFMGKCYEHIGRTGTYKECFQNSPVVAPTGTFKYHYKRRISAN